MALILTRPAAILWHLLEMRSLRLCVIAAALATFGGCFQSTTLVKVNGDGSGTIEQTMLFTGAALAQMRQLAAFGGGGGKAFDPFSEDQARNAAASIGPGVTYVSSTPIATGDGQGRSIVYAFADVNQLRISQQPPAPGGVTIRSKEVNTEAQAIRFVLTHEPGGNAVLRILFAPPAKPAAPPEGGAREAAPGRNKASPEQMAMMKQMFAGARIAVAVEPAGRLVRTTSPWVDGQRVTLIDLEFDQLVTNDAALERLQGIQNFMDARAALKDIPGLKVIVDREAMIEFAPR